LSDTTDKFLFGDITTLSPRLDLSHNPNLKIKLDLKYITNENCSIILSKAMGLHKPVMPCTEGWFKQVMPQLNACKNDSVYLTNSFAKMETD
jgi:hypothetical protein